MQKDHDSDKIAHGSANCNAERTNLRPNWVDMKDSSRLQSRYTGQSFTPSGVRYSHRLGKALWLSLCAAPTFRVLRCIGMDAGSTPSKRPEAITRNTLEDAAKSIAVRYNGSLRILA